MRRHVLLWTIAVAILPARLASQDSLPPPILRLKPGQRVRVLTVAGQLHEAPVARPTTDPAGIQLAAADSTIALAAIDSLWLRRTRAKRGAVIGGLALGIPSAVFWGGVCTLYSDGSGCDAWGVVAGLTLAGAAVGAGVGALIGSGTVRWELSYARPPASTLRRPRGDGQVRLGLRLRIP